MKQFNLSSVDLAKLQSSFISEPFARKMRLFRVSSQEGAALVGQKGRGDFSGIAFPYFLPDSQSPREYRLRRDNPELEYKEDGAV